MVEIKELMGKTLSSVVMNDEKDVILFATECGELYKMYHEQDCCECVSVEDIEGSIDDLIGSPITQAEEVTKEGKEGYESSTWTFYKMATAKGYVTIRWFGESNGYYSESVGLVKADSSGNFSRW